MFSVREGGPTNRASGASSAKDDHDQRATAVDSPLQTSQVGLPRRPDLVECDLRCTHERWRSNILGCPVGACPICGASGRSGGKATTAWHASGMAADDVFLNLAFAGVKELRRELQLDESSYLDVAGSAHADARSYVLYGVLDEVEKAAIHVMRLREMLPNEDAVDATEDRISRLVVQHVVEDLHARTRRLVETLVHVVLFAGTNHPDYYAHLVALTELDTFLRSNKELQDFHGAASANVAASVDRCTDHVRSLEARLDLARAWYLEKCHRSPLPSSRVRRVVFSTMNDRLKAALANSSASEKLCLGTTYAKGFGRASGTLHFNVSGAQRPGGALDSEISHVELLAFGILTRCHEIMGHPNAPTVERIARSLVSNALPGRLLHRMHVRDIAEGDFVVALGLLAQVVGVCSSELGYRSYELEFLCGTPMPETPRDWFPAQFVTRLFDADRLVAEVRGVPEKLALSSEFASTLKSADASEVHRSLRTSVVHAWQHLGLREHVLGRLLPTDRTSGASQVDGR